MVQGANKQKGGQKPISKRKDKKVAPKVKNTKEVIGRNENDEISKTIHKKVKEHQKKIYKSIEQTIIDNAKRNRERFELI